MSVWAKLAGKISIRGTKGFSVRKYIKSELDGEDFVLNVNDKCGHDDELHIELLLEGEGDYALRILQRLIDQMPVHYDLTLEVRYCK